MKLTFISDTHSQHDLIKLQSGDVLIHCGDISRKGSLEDIREFAAFIKEQEFRHKIVIAGNHDFCFEDERRSDAEDILKKNGIIYLNDSGINIDGVKFWGSPIQPVFFDWAFNRERGEDIKKHWDLIPDDTDVLITHGPPFGVLDECANGEKVGCTDLLNKVSTLKIKVHAFGHIHEGYGVDIKDGVSFVNACILDKNYKIKNKPITLEI